MGHVNELIKAANERKPERRKAEKTPGKQEFSAGGSGAELGGRENVERARWSKFSYFILLTFGTRYY